MDYINTRQMNDEDEKGQNSAIQKKIENRFLEERRIFLWGGVHDDSARDIVSKLLFLESEKPGEPITFFIHSPGGSVTSGYAILDTMNMISSPVHTVCMGMAASMGSILLSAGDKGHRYIYPLGEVMIHQPSIGYLQADATDLEIHAKQLLKTRDIAAKILADNCGQSVDQIMKDFDRDYWMDAKESIDYGIVDSIYSM